MTAQLPLVKMSDKERIEIGRNAAKLAGRLEALRVEYSEVKKDFTERIEEVTTTLMATLRELNEE